MATINCLVKSILQKETPTGLEQHKGEWMMTEFSFLGELSLKGAFFVGQNPVEQKQSKLCIRFQAHSSVPSAMKSFTYVHGYLASFMANLFYSIIFFFKDIWLCKPLLTIKNVHLPN